MKRAGLEVEQALQQASQRLDGPRWSVTGREDWPTTPRRWRWSELVLWSVSLAGLGLAWVLR